jgi:hypothetical protein
MEGIQMSHPIALERPADTFKTGNAVQSAAFDEKIGTGSRLAPAVDTHSLDVSHG